MRNIVIGLLLALLVVSLYYTYYIVPSNSKNVLGLSLDGADSYGVDFIGGSRGKIGLEGFIVLLRWITIWEYILIYDLRVMTK